jgi:hypothetical protein
MKLEIDTDGLCEALGPEFTPGMPVNCDHCLAPYHGLPESLDIAGLSSEEPSADLD